MSDTLEVPVLIVGGGPVGLSASILLSRFGVNSLLVEKHPGTTPFPKALHISTRTMELFRQWEVAEAVEAAGLPREQNACGVGPARARVEEPPHRGRSPARRCTTPMRAG